MAPPNRQLSEILSMRAELVRAIAITVGLALGVNLLASGLITLGGWSGAAVVAAGLISILAVFGLFASSALSQFTRSLRLEGVLAVEIPKQTVVSIRRYQFSEQTARNINALSIENKALGKAWSEGSLSGYENPKPPRATQSVEPEDKALSRQHAMGISRSRVEWRETPAIRLARESTEYFVLDILSTHLTDFFNGSDSKETILLTRRDIPSVLLDNRFLELFSRPVEEREVFSAPASDAPDGVGHEVVAIYTADGAFYDRFELVLPKGSKVQRLEGNIIEISTRRFSLRMEVDFDGMGAVLPPDFPELYAGVDFIKCSSFRVALDFDIKFRVWAFLTRGGWEDFKWLDSFLDTVDEEFSFDRFIRQIGWETAHTAAIISEHREPTTDAVVAASHSPGD